MRRKNWVKLILIAFCLADVPSSATASGLASCLKIGTTDVNKSQTIQFGQPYDLQIDNGCGREVWGFSSTLTITGPINQSFEDAYYYLSYGPAHNYAHFELGALPKGQYLARLQVNIQEDNSSVTVPVEGFGINTTPNPSQVKLKHTFICVNGKQVKRISSHGTKCPSGYKLKK